MVHNLVPGSLQRYREQENSHFNKLFLVAASPQCKYVRCLTTIGTENNHFNKPFTSSCVTSRVHTSVVDSWGPSFYNDGTAVHRKVSTRWPHRTSTHEQQVWGNILVERVGRGFYVVHSSCLAPRADLNLLHTSNSLPHSQYLYLWFKLAKS